MVDRIPRQTNENIESCSSIEDYMDLSLAAGFEWILEAVGFK